MASLEDLERRVSALERGAERDRSVERAVAVIVAESEVRLNIKIDGVEKKLTEKIDGLEKRVSDRIEAVEQRMTARVESSERRMVDILNERFDAVMDALDRPKP
jgi:hypothetical protein